MTLQRTTILDSACELYLEHGIDGFSMRKLAEMVGVTAPALYRHYESKERVFIDLIGEAYRRFGEALYGALRGGDPAERLELARTAYLDFAIGQPRLYQMLFAHQVLYASVDSLGLDGVPDEVGEQACAVGQFWVDRVRDCVDAGVLRPGNPEEIARTLWAHSHGAVSLFTMGVLQMDEEEFRAFYDDSCRRVWRGLGAEGTRHPSEAGIPDQGSESSETAAPAAIEVGVGSDA